MHKLYLITYNLYMNNNFGTERTITKTIDKEPLAWFRDKDWQTEDNWFGCSILMIHKVS